MGLLPPIVTINLTGVCQLRCPFCFGPSPDTQMLDPIAWRSIIEFLGQHGVRNLIVGGGEPLLYPGLKNVLQFAKRERLRTILATNCQSYSSILEVVDLIDWVEISLHGSSAEIHASAGGAIENFSVVLEVLDSISALGKPKIKVNTVVTSRNVANLPNLAKLVARYQINTWKLFEVRPRGSASPNPENIRSGFVSQTDWPMAAVLNEAREHMPNTRVVISQASSGDKAYLIIYPDGKALIPDGTLYINIGDLSSVHSWSTDNENEFIKAVNAIIENDLVIKQFETSFEVIQ